VPTIDERITRLENRQRRIYRIVYWLIKFLHSEYRLRSGDGFRQMGILRAAAGITQQERGDRDPDPDLIPEKDPESILGGRP
jgi:hypothetical protein